MSRLMGALASAAVLFAASSVRAEPPALFSDTAAGFVPFANDVPLMEGAGLRFAEVHELWARLGYMPVGDDVRHAFGVGGYRRVFRPKRFFRPVLGGLIAGLPATCTHDAHDRPKCAPPVLFVFAALGGFRLEPLPWLGFSLLASLGTDTHPNPFGMVELGATVAPR